MATSQLSTTLSICRISASTGFQFGEVVNRVEIELSGTISTRQGANRTLPGETPDSYVAVKIQFSDKLNYFDFMVGKAPSIGIVRLENESQSEIRAEIDLRLDSKYLPLLGGPFGKTVTMDFIFFKMDDDGEVYVEKSEDGAETKYVERVNIYLDSPSSET